MWHSDFFGRASDLRRLLCLLHICTRPQRREGQSIGVVRQARPDGRHNINQIVSLPSAVQMHNAQMQLLSVHDPDKFCSKRSYLVEEFEEMLC